MATKPGEPAGMTKVRQACLKRGAHGIKGLGRTFRIYDDNGSKLLDFDEFRNGLHDYGVTEIPQAEIKEIFSYIDKDGSGSLSFDEFLVALRPAMNKNRMDLIKKAFAKLDVDQSGVITIEDLMKNYKVDFHPKYKSGEMTKKQVLQEFLNNYQADGDDKVTEEEFINYYCGVSASIDQDVYFDLMMRNAWKF